MCTRWSIQYMQKVVIRVKKNWVIHTGRNFRLGCDVSAANRFHFSHGSFVVQNKAVRPSVTIFTLFVRWPKLCRWPTTGGTRTKCAALWSISAADMLPVARRTALMTVYNLNTKHAEFSTNEINSCGVSLLTLHKVSWDAPFIRLFLLWSRIVDGFNLFQHFDSTSTIWLGQQSCPDTVEILRTSVMLKWCVWISKSKRCNSHWIYGRRLSSVPPNTRRTSEKWPVWSGLFVPSQGHAQNVASEFMKYAVCSVDVNAPPGWRPTGVL